MTVRYTGWLCQAHRQVSQRRITIFRYGVGSHDDQAGGHPYRRLPSVALVTISCYTGDLSASPVAPLCWQPETVDQVVGPAGVVSEFCQPGGSS